MTYVRDRKLGSDGWKLASALLTLICWLPAPAAAQITASLVASGFDEPVAVVPDPALPVFYVVERKGLIRIVNGGVVQSDPFIDLRAAVDTGAEGGLLGMAFAPDGTGRVFLNFTNQEGATVIARFSRAPSSPLRAEPASRFDLRWPDGARAIQQPFDNHNGGHLAFGPDGYLYVGLGDGGGTNDPLNLAQSPHSLLGKMLRLDVTVDDAHPDGYVVPADNPYASNPALGLGEVWDIGLRNPWRYAFDDYGPGATGGLFIADVGQGAREEINYEPAFGGGRNYGWRVREGSIPTPLVPQGAAGPGADFTEPILDYDHTQGNAIVGGLVYRGNALPAMYRGRYFFADFATARVWSMGWAIDASNGEAVVTDVVEHTSELDADMASIVSFARDRDGELYVVTLGGHIWKLVADRRTPNPPLDLQADVDGSTVTLRWSPPADGPAPAAYRLEAGSVPGAADIAVLTVPAHQSTLVVHQVPSATYYVVIRSIGPDGPSDAGAAVEVVVGPSPRQTPLTPE
jgi:glucose/arabinose dehydrogenase